MTSTAILERMLYWEHGHYLTQIRAYDALSRADRRYVITAEDVGEVALNRAPGDTRPEPEILRILPSGQRKKAAADPDASAREAAATLADTCAKLPLGASDAIIVPSATRYEMLLAMGFAAAERPVCRLRILAVSFVEALSEDELATLRQIVTNGRITLHSETPELAQALINRFGLPCQPGFLLPCTIVPGQTAPASAATLKDGTFRIGCLGKPRKEKGSYFVPHIINATRRAIGRAKGVEAVTFVYQTAPQRVHRRALFNLELAKTNWSKRGVKLELLVGTQSVAALTDQLFSLDALLLPYSIERYATSGSGMVIDAVLAGLPVIHTKGMAMADLLGHGNALAATGADAFAAQILRMAQNPQDFADGAARARAALSAKIGGLEMMF